MFMELDSSLLQRFDELQARDDDFALAMSNLARSHREGKHMVTGPRPLLDKLAHWLSLATLDRDVYRHIGGRRNDAVCLRREVSHYIVIAADGPLDISDSAGATRFRVPYQRFADSAQVQASYLVAENINDANFYRRVARAYAAHQRMNRISAECEPVSGGGDTTAEIFADKASQRMTLCLADSDRAHPDGALGATARKVVQTARTLSERIAHHHILPARELENLLPGRLVVRAVEADATRRSRCERARELGLFCTQDALAYLDLKHDITRCQLRSMPEPSPTTMANSKSDAELCAGECEQRVPPCVAAHGLGGKLVRDVAAFAARETPHKLAEFLFAGDAGSVWNPLAHLLFSFACAPSALRA